MKKLLGIFVFGMMALVACSPSGERMMVGKWKAERLIMQNWDRYAEDMQKIAEANIMEAIERNLKNGGADTIEEADIEATKEKSLENFTNNFREARNSLRESILKSITEYRTDGTTETMIGSSVVDTGTWSFSLNDSVLTETNKYGKQVVSKVIMLEKDKMEFETIFRLRDTMSGEEAKAYDDQNLAALLDYELKFSIFFRKSKNK